MGGGGGWGQASEGGLSVTYVIRSFLSFSFFRPPKAILVPGMYFLGFSRYSNYEGKRHVSRARFQSERRPWGRRAWVWTYQSVLLPLDALLLVGIRVGVTLNGAGVAAKQAVQGGSDLVAAASLDGVALGTTGLEQTSTLLSITCATVSKESWKLLVVVLDVGEPLSLKPIVTIR